MNVLFLLFFYNYDSYEDWNLPKTTLSSKVVEILFEEGFFAFSSFPSIQLLYACISADNYKISRETGHTAGTHSSPSSCCCQTLCKWIDSWASIIRAQCSLMLPHAILPYGFDPPMLNLSLALVVSRAFHPILKKKVIQISHHVFSLFFFFNYYYFLLCLLVILYVRFRFLFIIFKFLCKSASYVSFYLVFPSSSLQNKIKQNKTVFCLCLSLKPYLPYIPIVLSMPAG